MGQNLKTLEIERPISELRNWYIPDRKGQECVFSNRNDKDKIDVNDMPRKNLEGLGLNWMWYIR